MLTRFKKIDILIAVSCMAFAFYLMFHTFDKTESGNLVISSRVWSDFAATIPLIRSFSLGSNFPPEYPIFPGEPIRYHFGFFYLVGLLEKTGIPIHWALNAPSAIFFGALLYFTYFLGAKVFKSKKVGIIALVLFIFNSSLTFMEFFKNPLRTYKISHLTKLSEFPSFGPYDGKVVSAFWNLNIYTNQRHLALAYLFYLIVIFFFWRKREEKIKFKHLFLFGILIGIFPIFHVAVFGMVVLSLVVFGALLKRQQTSIFVTLTIAAVFALPLISYLGFGKSSGSSLIHLGYLSEKQTLSSVMTYWIHNLGLSLATIPLGFLMAKKSQRIFFAPFFVLFAIGNLFQLSPEIAANHKFFNLFIIGGNLYSAYFLVNTSLRGTIYKIFSAFVFFFLILSGIIDLMPVINDGKVILEDIPKNKAATFILESTPKDSVFLNSNYLYTPSLIAGRKIFLGWPYFPWSAGYNTNDRHAVLSTIWSTSSKSKACNLLLRNDIDFIELQKPHGLENTFINEVFFDSNFKKIYSQSAPDIKIYEVRTSCN